MTLFQSGAVPRQPRLFFARYDGMCSECGEDFEAGERIGYDENDQICCEECLSGDSPVLPAVPTRMKQQKPCRECFIVHAGPCF